MPARLLSRFVLHLRDLLAAQVAGWLRGWRRRAARAWASRPGGAQALAIGLSLTLTLASLAAAGAQRTRQASLPSALDWRAAAALLEREARPGDAVALSPAWLERARGVLPASLPVIAAARLDGELLPGLRRVWLVSAADTAWTGWSLEVALARRAAHADAQVLGGLEVTRFDLREPVLPIAALVERAPDLAETREAGGQPRACLVLRPRAGTALVRRLPATPLGRLLVGHLTRLPGPGEAPVRVSIQVDDQELGAIEVAPADGRRPFELDTARLAGTSRPVTLVATTPGEPAGELCLEALALP